MSPQIQTVPGSRYPTMQQAASMDINSILGTFVDRGIWPYHDKLYAALSGQNALLPATAQPFSIGIGGLDQVTGLQKTKLQTNLPAPGGSFPITRCFILESIGFWFPGWITKAAADLIIENTYFEFSIGEKIFFEGLLELWPGGAGLMGVSTQTGEETWTISLPIPDAMRSFGPKFSKYIAPLVPFNFKLTLNNPPTLVAPGVAALNVPPGTVTNPTSGAFCINWLKIVLDGVGDRPVS
jgi:hypothetical protein